MAHGARRPASATGLLRVLLAASVAVPLLIFLLISWLDYRDAFAGAENEMRHRSEVAGEQAEKVLDGQSQVADRVTDLIRGMDAATIRRSERALHEAFGRIVARLPQVQSVLLAARDGHPLVSAGTYPVPQAVDLSSRDYFAAVVGGFAGTFVSKLQVGSVNHQLFFGLAQPWLAADGSLAGIIDVAIAPRFFQDFYRILVDEAGDGAGQVVTLVRDDGQILVRYPPLTGLPPPGAANAAFLTAVRARPEAGLYQGRSVVDPGGRTRVFAYRRVQGYPLYVVAGRSRDAIVARWRREMLGHAAFAGPITLALFAVAWTALARTGRERAALARAQAEIERREQAEAALLRAQRLEAVGQMTGGVAHDFNNLLTVILGNAEMLRKRAGDPVAVRRIAESIVLAAVRGGEVTQKLLAFSRRQMVRPELVDLNQRLLDFRELLQQAASAAVGVDFDLGTGLGPVRLDPGHFEAAVLNLVGNARDAMPHGGRVRIVTRTLWLAAGEHAELPSGGYARVSVADTGSGMDADTAAKAFEPFFTTKDVGQGTGLGLSQVYGFAKQAGGDVRLVTSPGQGTTVELLLPHAAAGPAGPGAPPARSVAPRRAVPGEVVLVVEDDEAVQGIAVEGLRDLGYATVTATTAQAALSTLQGGGRVDLLFSDIVMPGGMSGLQLAAEAVRLRPALKVLLTSGHDAGFDTTRLDGIPMLAKPYDRAQLAARVAEVLGG